MIFTSTTNYHWNSIQDTKSIKVIPSFLYIYSFRIQLDISSDSSSVTLLNQQSGGLIPTIYIALVDEFGQIVGSDSSSVITLSISESIVEAAYTPTLAGTLTQTAQNGTFKFADLTFTAKPGITYS